MQGTQTERRRADLEQKQGGEGRNVSGPKPGRTCGLYHVGLREKETPKNVEFWPRRLGKGRLRLKRLRKRRGHPIPQAWPLKGRQAGRRPSWEAPSTQFCGSSKELPATSRHPRAHSKYKVAARTRVCPLCEGME